MVACDLHPQFFTTKLAHELGERFKCPVLKVQHHHAHAAALSMDWDVDEFICIAADGVGYGEDGSAWGGEILYYQGAEYERISQFNASENARRGFNHPLPCQDDDGYALSIYYDKEEIMEIMKTHYLDYFPHGAKEIDIVANQLDKNFNLTETTSTGRVLDAIAATLHICGERTYEGECAMKLESTAYPGEDNFEYTY